MRRVVSTVCFVSFVLAVTTLPGPAGNVPTPEGVTPEDVVPRGSPPAPGPAAQSHIENFTKTAAFLASLQNASSGGLHEAEDNPYENTDNTLEAIWVWSRYARVTGDAATYLPNITAAWSYAIANPAWTEPDSGIVYSSAWALRAELEYRRSYSDWTYNWYANQSADDGILLWGGNDPIFPPSSVARGHIKGWAAGNLYEYGLDLGSPTYRQAALTYGNATKTWIEANPNRLAAEDWAMAGGAAMWGVVNSTMREYPDATWVTAYAPFLDTDVPFPGVGPGNSQNGWEAWYALGHHAAWRMTGNRTYFDNFLAITDRLLAEDVEDDGGIPTNRGDPSDTDESWVTSYRAFFSLNVLLSLGSGLVPEPPDLTAILPGPGWDNATIVWLLSPHDAPGWDVVRYDIYHATTFDPFGGSYALIGNVAAGTNAFVHSRPAANTHRDFYVVVAVDSEGLSSRGSGGAIMESRFPPGWVLLGNYPPNLDVGNSYEVSNPTARYFYDATDTLNPWRAWPSASGRYEPLPSEPWSSRAYWQLADGGERGRSGSLVLILGGSQYYLRAGWNLVNYPSLVDHTVADAFAGLAVRQVQEHLGGSPLNLRPLGPNDMLTQGKGYWVLADVDQVWQVENW